MSEAFHQWGSDLTLSASGDLLLVDGTTRGMQRVLRRLLTNPGDYIWHVASPNGPAYGAGVPARVGQTLDVRAIMGTIRAQMFLEDAVARSPDPVIKLTPTATGSLFCEIRYNDAVSGEPVTLSFDISR